MREKGAVKVVSPLAPEAVCEKGEEELWMVTVTRASKIKAHKKKIVKADDQMEGITWKLERP